MAVAASRTASRAGQSASRGLYLGSTTLPFADRLNAGIVKTALNLGRFWPRTSPAPCGPGPRALITALELSAGGTSEHVLVTAADRRETKAAYFYEMWFGDGAASLLVGRDDVIAEFLGSHTLALDFVDHYRGSQNEFDYIWEERWVRDEGYGKIIPRAVNGLFQKLT